MRPYQPNAILSKSSMPFWIYFPVFGFVTVNGARKQCLTGRIENAGITVALCDASTLREWPSCDSHYLARFFFFLWYHLSTSYSRLCQ